MLLAVLAATTAAGIVLAYLLLPFDQVDPATIAFALWVIAAPPVVMVASVRLLLESRRWTRGPLGEVLYFFFWIGTIAIVAATQGGTGFGANMVDLTGFMSPISHSLDGDANFTIGGGGLMADGARDRIFLDVMGGIRSEGYLASRAAWLGIAALVPLVAGLVYLPHVPGKARRKPIAWLRFLEPGAPPKADPDARAARPAALPWLNLLLAEMRLVAGGRKALLLALAVAVAGWFAPWSTVAGPAAMLLLVFTTTAHAGRSEAAGLLALTRTGVVDPMARRVAFVVGGALLGLLMGSGAIAQGVLHEDFRPLIEAPIVGGATALAASLLGTLTRTATAPRLVLLIAWYGYLNWAGGAG